VSAACDLLLFKSSTCCCRINRDSKHDLDCKFENGGSIYAPSDIESRACMPHIVGWQHSMEETQQGLKRHPGSGCPFNPEEGMGRSCVTQEVYRSKGNKDDERRTFIDESVCIRWT